jgi:hypothetical protein
LRPMQPGAPPRPRRRTVCATGRRRVWCSARPAVTIRPM